MPAVLHILAADNFASRHVIVGDVVKILGVSGIHMRAYLPQIMPLALKYWPAPRADDDLDSSLPPLHVALMTVLRTATVALGREFAAYVPDGVRVSLAAMTTDSSQDSSVTRQAMEVLALLGSLLDQYLSTAISALCRVLYLDDLNPLPVREAAVRALTDTAEQDPRGDTAADAIRALCSAAPTLLPL